MTTIDYSKCPFKTPLHIVPIGQQWAVCDGDGLSVGMFPLPEREEAAWLVAAITGRATLLARCKALEEAMVVIETVAADLSSGEIGLSAVARIARAALAANQEQA